MVRLPAKTLYSALVAGALALGLAGVGAAQAPQAARPANGAARGPTQLPLPPLFLKESWSRQPADRGQVPVTPAAVSSPNLTLQVYGLDARNLDISGTAGSASDVVNLWTGLSTEPVAATLRDKANYVDLRGRAKIRWVVRTSGFHVVRPVLKLADGTLLIGDHADASTTLFNQTEFAVADVRWIKLDPQKVVTRGTYGAAGQAASWVENPDLSKVDEVGFADLMPGSGHGSGGWINVGTIEVYGTPVRR